MSQNRVEFNSKKLMLEKLPTFGLLPLGGKLESALGTVVERQANLIMKAKLNIYAIDARSPEKFKSWPPDSYEEVNI